LKLRRLTPDAAAIRDKPLEWVIELSLGAAFLSMLAIRLLRQGEDRVVVRVPLCEWCKDAGVKITLRQVSWDTHHVVLLVHREFKARLYLHREKTAKAIAIGVGA
jgi:hypothetical protein